MEKQDINNIKIERLFSTKIVPVELIEQIKGRWWDAFGFYSIDLTKHPNMFLCGLFNEKHNIIGFFWCSINTLERRIYLYALSVLKQYQGNRDIVPMVIDFLKECQKRLKLDGIIATTTRPNAASRYGFKRSDLVLMEV